MIDITDEEFFSLREYLCQCCGIDVPLDKSYLFKNRLHDLLVETKCNTFAELHDILMAGKDGGIQKKLIACMTTNETSFFRDTHPFESLYYNIMPFVAEMRRAESIYTPPALRIWSAGCSTGQEPYSIAMIVNEWVEEANAYAADRVTILASDISERALAKARSGIYSDAELMKGVLEMYRDKYFKRERDNWVVADKIRQMINFQEINLSQDLRPDIGCFDVIFCRNVIIYFSNELKQKIVKQFHRVLNPGGILILGASENLYNISDDFMSEHIGQTILYRVVK